MALESGQVLDLGGRLFVLKGVDTSAASTWKTSPSIESGAPSTWTVARPKFSSLYLCYENFGLPVGPIMVRCYHSPAKENRILELVQVRTQFMQGGALLRQRRQPRAHAEVQ